MFGWVIHTKGGQLIWLKGHFQKVAMSRGPKLLEKQSNLGSSFELKNILDLKIFVNASVGH